MIVLKPWFVSLASWSSMSVTCWKFWLWRPLASTLGFGGGGYLCVFVSDGKMVGLDFVYVAVFFYHVELSEGQALV